ncbi:MAG: creatininase family protein [Paracoccaceae bacterium]
MRLDHATWPEVEAYLTTRKGIILPVGSTEQHGPMGLIGTDAMCATAIAEAAGERAGAFVAPVLGYTPASFNMSFPGTMSLSEPVFTAVFQELVLGLQGHGFKKIYVLNAHGANLAPMRAVKGKMEGVRIRSWWDFDPVNVIRDAEFGAWEGLHATPAEISITRALYRVVEHGAASSPPRMLSDAEKAGRAGDNHGSAARHKAEFPDGRVGSHSAMATAEIGRRLLEVAADCVAEDFKAFSGEK